MKCLSLRSKHLSSKHLLGKRKSNLFRSWLNLNNRKLKTNLFQPNLRKLLHKEIDRICSQKMMMTPNLFSRLWGHLPRQVNIELSNYRRWLTWRTCNSQMLVELKVVAYLLLIDRFQISTFQDKRCKESMLIMKVNLPIKGRKSCLIKSSLVRLTLSTSS